MVFIMAAVAQLPSWSSNLQKLHQLELTPLPLEWVVQLVQVQEYLHRLVEIHQSFYHQHLLQRVVVVGLQIIQVVQTPVIQAVAVVIFQAVAQDQPQMVVAEVHRLLVQAVQDLHQLFWVLALLVVVTVQVLELNQLQSMAVVVVVTIRLRIKEHRQPLMVQAVAQRFHHPPYVRVIKA
jgi:hypothetical protein